VDRHPFAGRGSAFVATVTRSSFLEEGVPMRARLLAVVGLLAWGGVPVAGQPAPGLAPPARLQADGKPINVDIGHAAPFVADLHGDGKLHLLVGQFGDGKLRVYRNEGTNTAPSFKDFTWLKAGRGDAKVPSG
jgi:hypothetical protein